MREYRYVVDRDGRIFHDGTEIADPVVLRFFLRAMRRTPDGRYRVVCQDEHNWFEGDPSPFVVQRLRLTLDGERLRAVQLCFAGDYREPLERGSLETEEGHLFCRIRGGALDAHRHGAPGADHPDAVRARFGRVALQQIAPFLVEDARGPALLLDGTRDPIVVAAGGSRRRTVTRGRTMKDGGRR